MHERVKWVYNYHLLLALIGRPITCDFKQRYHMVHSIWLFENYLRAVWGNYSSRKGDVNDSVKPCSQKIHIKCNVTYITPLHRNKTGIFVSDVDLSLMLTCVWCWLVADIECCTTHDNDKRKPSTKAGKNEVNLEIMFRKF